jgi:hypothetical protein
MGFAAAGRAAFARGATSNSAAAPITLVAAPRQDVGFTIIRSPCDFGSVAPSWSACVQVTAKSMGPDQVTALDYNVPMSVTDGGMLDAVQRLPEADPRSEPFTGCAACRPATATAPVWCSVGGVLGLAPVDDSPPRGLGGRGDGAEPRRARAPGAGRGRAPLAAVTVIAAVPVAPTSSVVQPRPQPQPQPPRAVQPVAAAPTPPAPARSRPTPAGRRCRATTSTTTC